jgi:uncharacterized protein (TIGR03435 family)
MPVQKLSFEVASVRAVSPARGGGGRGSGPITVCGGNPQIDPSRFAVSSVTFYNLITMAYGMGPCLLVSASSRIVGGPEWIMSDQFAVEARIPRGVLMGRDRPFRVIWQQSVRSWWRPFWRAKKFFKS